MEILQPVEVVTPGNTTVVYATFWQRFGAILIDAILIAVFAGSLDIILGDTKGGIATLINIGYYVGFLVLNQQTIGKMVLKIKVVREDGQKITFFNAFMREVVGRFVCGITIGIGYLAVLWDGKKQGFHDKIALTYVVKI